MLKRFTKSGKKQNKSGVILITILFILAVAFILIGSALIMTANTRKRLYSFAEGSQARLTVTSAAQLFENALQTQELSDKKFKELCDAGTTVWFTDANVPGMGGTGGPTGSSPDNCTCATFGYNGTKPTVAFTTIIDDEVENVLLTYEGTPETTHTSPFAFQVELGEGGRLDKIDIGNVYGASTRYNADDNLVVSRGAGSAPMDSCDFYSTFITTKPMRSASGTHYYGDLVYAGDSAGVNMNGGGTGSGADMVGCGTVFFINCDQMVWNSTNAASTHEMFTAHGETQIIFCNVDSIGGAVEQCWTGFANEHIYEVQRANDGTLTPYTLGFSFGAGLYAPGTGFANSAATGKDLEYYVGNLDQYIDPNYIDPSTSSSRPSSFAEFVGYAATPSGGGVSINGGNGTAPAGTPSLTAGTTNTGTHYKLTGNIPAGTQYNISVANNDVVVYLEGTVTLNNGAKFVVSGGNGTNSSHKCYFIISRGGQLVLNGDNQPTGFFSQNCHAVAITDPIIQTQAPIIYIVGAGTNHNADLDATGTRHGQISCCSNQGNYIEAMVALYPNTDAEDDGGDFYSMQGPSCNFYGRIIARTILNQNGAHMKIPYCPQFSTGDDPNQLYEVHSAWTLVSFDYYYDISGDAEGSALHT